MVTSVIISTYNSPAWLQKVLWGYFSQSQADFELVIADDGSSPETGHMLKEMAAACPVPLTHVWQPDDGFQKCRILNKAVAVARGNRILLTDGDCVPRRDFVEIHAHMSRPSEFLTGGYFKLPYNLSQTLSRESIIGQSAFSPRWLMRHGLPFTGKLLKLAATKPIGRLLNQLTPTKRTWNGHNASCLRSDAIRVNGFNEAMQYGGLDVEFGLRLQRAGLSGRQIRYSAIVVHLHHDHAYVTTDMIQRSRHIKEITRNERSAWADRGINQWLNSNGEATLNKEDHVIRY